MPHYGDKLRAQLKAQKPGVELPAAARPSDIAVIGMACRFPQAPDLDGFWRLLTEGRDAVTEIPLERWDWREYYDANPDANDKHYNRWGGFLEAVDQFDPFFFHMSPKEATLMDPQQRLFLETVWRTLEHAGYAGNALAGQEIGVFAGCTNNYYAKRYHLVVEPEDHYIAAIGNWNAALPSRVSYFFDFQGPSMLVDTLCSSTLVALHLACESLRRGECAAAIAGGVNLILSPEHFIGASKLKAHAPDGRCKSFDHRANGFTSGEGVGAVLLKPLATAQLDGDTIYGVIKGSAVNHDGRTNGIMAPNPLSQTRLIRRALQTAEVSADSVSYVECHGTGTSLGDPMEIDGLARAYGKENAGKANCAIGSVKSNIGHLEAAAGAAGLIKVLLALWHKQLPPSLHFQQPNPLINFRETPFYVNTVLKPWDSLELRRAGISSFGLSGVNAHAIVEQAPISTNSLVPAPIYLLPISARSLKSLREFISSYHCYLDTNNNTDLRDLCWTASVGTGQFAHRIAFIADTRQALVEKLRQFLLDESFSATPSNLVVRAGATSFTSDPAGPCTDFDRWINAAQEYLADRPVDWATLYSAPRPRRVPLPAYPFERASYWAASLREKPTSRISQVGRISRMKNHPFLGQMITHG